MNLNLEQPEHSFSEHCKLSTIYDCLLLIPNDNSDFRAIYATWPQVMQAIHELDPVNVYIANEFPLPICGLYMKDFQ